MDHLEPRWGWKLIRDGGQPTPAEVEHLRECPVCHGWLSVFVEMARGVGFILNFEIPPLERPRAKGA
jgi:hypothetical protein